MTANASPAPTPAQIEGPYWRPGSPERGRVAADATVGERLVLEGTVRSMTGAPLAGAWVDVWQADGDGRYDVDGDGLRGHQFTDAAGRFRFETVVPGDYVDHFDFDNGSSFDVHRAPHIHLKVKAPRRQTLTTQLYLPRHPLNETDILFLGDCVLRDGGGEPRRVSFEVVLPPM